MKVAGNAGENDTYPDTCVEQVDALGYLQVTPRGIIERLQIRIRLKRTECMAVSDRCAAGKLVSPSRAYVPRRLPVCAERDEASVRQSAHLPITNTGREMHIGEGA